MARYAAEHKGETRKRILAASEAMMKRRGVDAASVDAVMRGAGLTVGGFYAHFASKDELAAETLLYALEHSFDRMVASLERQSGPDVLRSLIRDYLAQAEDPRLEEACPLTLVLGDVARADDARKARFVEVTRAMLDRVAPHFPGRDGMSPRETALATYAALVGAVGFARTAPSSGARRAILRACETMLVSWLGLEEGGSPSPRPAIRRKAPRSRRRA